MERYARLWAETRAMLSERAREVRNPFDHTDPAEAEAVLNRLNGVDHEPWAAAFSEAAQPHEERARAAEAAGNIDLARHEYMLAYGFYRVARYPVMTTPGKRSAYVKSQEMYLAAGRHMDPPVQRVEMPFKGRPGEGNVAIGLLRLPRADHKLPVVVAWGGIDSFKEERRVEPFLARGFAGLNVDMPGVADAPLAGSEDAERLWDAILDWIAAQPGLDSRQVILWGGSTGGYWAAKVAHTHADRLAGSIEHGGPAHYAFQAEWIERAQRGEYPFELAETLALAFGHSGFDAWVDYAPRLSLLDQGVLDRPCAPMLCINGIDDSVFPIADQYLLLEHGSVKSARLFPGGHMGHTPATMPLILDWAVEAARRGAAE